MPQIIGGVTVYTGSEHPYLTGLKVRILLVMRPIPGVEDCELYRTDKEIEAAGGVRRDDVVEVAPIMEGGRTSFASSDARPEDLECFAPPPR